ncbi:MAG: phosphoribosyltransferase family protein [Persephonella sp.]|nr:phosphoribosyltransferase family protein [Persephonella sp.]
MNLVTYVPLHRKTLKERGFNHLREILVHIFPSYMIREVVEKVRDTQLQMNLTRADRIINLKGAFRLSGNVKGKRVLVFDDIMTTGTTMLHMYKTIKKGRPEKIFGYLIGR